MAGNTPAICLEGWTPVASGLHLGIDPVAGVPTRVLDVPEQPGLVQVHLGDGSLGATRIGDALSREHVATIARMVETLSPALTASITRAEVDARTAAHGIPVELPGRLDLHDPADQRVQPVDDAGRVTDPRLATGVRVLPERHLADTLTTATGTGVAPAHPPMPGQLRLLGDAAAIGLPATLVNARHGGLTEVRPAGATSRVTNLNGLLTHLDTLRPGERAVVEVTRTAGAPPQTYHVVADADGLSVLRFTDGTATAQPLPRTFDTMTVTMPGQLGSSAAGLATMLTELPPIDLADLAACVTGIRNFARDLYGSVRTGQAVDDLATLPGTLTRSADPSPDPFAAVTDRQWGAFDALSTVSKALAGAAAGTRGATVFALVGRPGAIGHAVAFRGTTDGLQAVDFRAGKVGTVRPAESVAADLADARMLLVDGNGQVTEVTTALESASTVRSLVDAGLPGPDGIRYAGKPSKSSGNGGRGDKKRGDGKRVRESDGGGQVTSKRPATGEANALGQVRSILARYELDFGRLPQQGRSTDKVNFRYPRSYKATDDDPLAPVGQSLRHLSLALYDAGQRLRDGQKASIADNDRDFEMQSMIVNGRLVVANNSDTTTQLLNDRVSEIPDHPIAVLLHERGRPRYRAQERIEAQRRLNDAISKIDNSSAEEHPRPATSVTDILASEGRTVMVDAADAERIRTVLTSPDYQNAIILLQYSGDPDMHAEQKLMVAIDRAGLSALEIWGDFSIHGRMRPCLGCLIALEHLGHTHRVQYNHNPGSAYDSAFASVLSHLPQVRFDPRDSQAVGNWVLTRLEELLSAGFRTNYSAWSNEQAHAHSVVGSAPQYGLQHEGERPNDRRNYETPSTSGDERFYVEYEPTKAGQIRTVRQDLRRDPAAVRLRELSESYQATRQPNEQLPAEWTRLVMGLYERLQNARAISEYTAGIDENTVLKHAKDGERLLLASAGSLTTEIENALWQALREAIPPEWRDNLPNARSSKNITSDMRDVLIQMKAWGVKNSHLGKSPEVGLPTTTFSRYYRGLPEVEREMPAALRQETAAPSPTSLAFRPAASAFDIAAQEQYEQRLTDFYEVDGIQWYVQRGQYYQWTTDSAGVTNAVAATRAQTARIQQFLSPQQAESSSMAATRSGGASSSSYNYSAMTQDTTSADPYMLSDELVTEPTSSSYMLSGGTVTEPTSSSYMLSDELVTEPTSSSYMMSDGTVTEPTSSSYMMSGGTVIDTSHSYTLPSRPAEQPSAETTETGYAPGSDTTSDTSSEHGGSTAPQYRRGTDYFVGDDWVVFRSHQNEWEQRFTRPGHPGRVYRPIVGHPQHYEVRDSGGRNWQYVKHSRRHGNIIVRHLAAPVTTLGPLTGEPSTTPLAQADGVVLGAPGSEVVRDLLQLRLPEGHFKVLGEGYRNDTGDTVSGGIRTSSTEYAAADAISAQIPPGTAAVDLIACEVISTGTLRELFRRRPEMTITALDTELFVVQGVDGATGPAKVFAAETVWVDGTPQLVQTPANQFRAYRPGMSPDAEPEPLGHVLPGTDAPTKEEMARAVEASGAFHKLRTGIARHLGSQGSPVDQIVRTLTTTGLDDPKPGLQRARPLVDDNSDFNRDLRALLERQIDHGQHLSNSLKNLGKQGYIRSTLGDRLHVAKHRVELNRAIGHLRGALTTLPGPRVGVAVSQPPDRQALEARTAVIADAIEDYAYVAEEIAKHMRELVTDAAVKAAVRGQESKTKKALEQSIGLFEGALGWTAGVFLPTGLSAAPALVGFAGKSAGMLAMKAFEEYQASTFQKQNSSTKALLLTDLRPDLMARSIAASYQKGFDLFMAAAGIGGAYVPGWPVISSGVTKIFKNFFAERVKLLEQQITALKAAQQGRTIQENEIYRRVGDRLWLDLRTELKTKLTDLATVQQIVNAAKGEPELIGLIGIGTDFAVQLGLGVVLTLFPPRPAVKIDGEDLRKVILDVISNRNPADTIMPSTATRLTPDQIVPASVPQTDSHGRQILGYKASLSQPDAPYVKINMHGTKLWGTLAGARFTPAEPDPGAFVSMEAWRDRVIGPDHYIETVRDSATGAVGESVRVDGSWHQPWPDKYHFLFIHKEDGAWEWAHAFSPTGRMDTDEFNLKAEFDRHRQWLKPFTFEAPAALAVGFGPRKTEPMLDSWALHQFADHVAWKAADLSRTYGPQVPLKIHVEGGGNGHNAVRARIDRLRGVSEQAVEVGRARAEALRTPLVTMLAAALDRFRYLHPGQADRLPRAEDLVAPAATRGSRLDASALPAGLLKQAAGLDDDALHRQTRIWYEELTVAAPGSPATAHSSLESSFHESDLDAKPTWLIDAQERMPHPPGAPANLVSDAGALAAVGAPPRELVKLAEDNPGQVYFWLSTPARQAPAREQLTQLNEVLEQFGQGKTQVTVFTKGLVSDELRTVIAWYGGALANSAPARAGGLNVSLDNPWHVQPADPTVPRSQRPDQPSAKLDGKLADAVAKLHRDPGIARADEQFGEFVWGGLSVREQYERLTSAPATYLTQANMDLAAGMSQRVGTSMRAGIVNPLLAFGAETDVVPRYHESTAEDRPKVVVSSVYELADAGVKGDVPITEKFQSLVEATGRGVAEAGDRNRFDFTVALLKAVDLARAGQFTDVAAWVAENKPRLDAAMKGTWVDALGDVVKDLRTVGNAGEAQRLERVLAAVYDC